MCYGRKVVTVNTLYVFCVDPRELKKLVLVRKANRNVVESRSVTSLNYARRFENFGGIRTGWGQKL
jgi:hypothetical protein